MSAIAAPMDEEPIKAASSDALKRCAVMFGVGRHLYSDNGSGRAPSLDAPAPREASTSRTGDGGTCPDHGQPWTLKPAGVSKAGREYDAFWKCDGKYDDGSYCKNKPPKAWAARHEQ